MTTWIAFKKHTLLLTQHGHPRPEVLASFSLTKLQIEILSNKFDNVEKGLCFTTK